MSGETKTYLGLKDQSKNTEELYNSKIGNECIKHLLTQLLKPYKVIKDPIHGDIEVTKLESRIIDTFDFQRLRRIRQLGPGYLVYPGAQHTRFEHSIGTLAVAQKMLHSLKNNPYRLSPFDSEEYDYDKKGLYEIYEITKFDEIIARLAALLHDIVVIAFSHTFEKEGNLVNAQWADEGFVRIFDPTIKGSNNYQDSGYLSLYEAISRTVSEELQYIKKCSEVNKDLFVKFISYIVLHAVIDIFVISIILEHEEEYENKNINDIRSIVLKNEMYKKLTKIMSNIYNKTKSLNNKIKNIDLNELYIENFNKNKYAIADMIMNTVCADLLDYVKRDSYYTGLSALGYDTLIFRYITLVKYKTPILDSTENLKIKETNRLAYRISRRKTLEIKLSIISNLMEILENRYKLFERAHLHRTKVSASTMLIEAFNFILRYLEVTEDVESGDELWSKLYLLGDDEFLTFLEDFTKKISNQDHHKTIDSHQSKIGDWRKVLDPKDLINVTLRLIKMYRTRHLYKALYVYSWDEDLSMSRTIDPRTPHILLKAGDFWQTYLKNPLNRFLTEILIVKELKKSFGDKVNYGDILFYITPPPEKLYKTLRVKIYYTTKIGNMLQPAVSTLEKYGNQEETVMPYIETIKLKRDSLKHCYKSLAGVFAVVNKNLFDLKIFKSESDAKEVIRSILGNIADKIETKRHMIASVNESTYDKNRSRNGTDILIDLLLE